ncbi:unnamed protein product [Blepharisma stoltei]|uniref:NADP-dependent oxidoreductase domain-containing protein n=1 Tax=Blepharisma stoltei TaxID=1481888 RepID=A0AAU9IZL1_9CILI|nr:unnamed protein product [Blepharisma stoltei]
MLRQLFRNFSSKIPGFATGAGTEQYSFRNQKVVESHWRTSYQGLVHSSLGIGTYMGAPDDETDQLVKDAIVQSVTSGTVNVIDTAINYRYQKAERAVGKAISHLIQENFKREELFVASKIGYIPEDADNGIPGQAVIEDLKTKNLLTNDDVVGGIHCMHPAFLEDQLERSLNNLGLETLDLLYIHNAAESQLPLIHEEKFLERLAKAFEFCEKKRQDGKIVSYGMASWICFRSPPTEKDLHVSLEQIVQMAERVGGNDHGFRYIQVPINIAMPEAFVYRWQMIEGSEHILLNVAKKLRINIMVSSPLLQGKILELKLSRSMLGIELQAAKHVQLIRSIPSESIKSVLIGMKTPRNVTMNTQIGFVESLNREEFWHILKPEGKEDAPVTIDLW